MSGGEHGHEHGQPAGGIGWTLLDSLVWTTGALIAGIAVEWAISIYRERRQALADMGGPDGRPLVDLDALRAHFDRQSGGQGHPDPGSPVGAVDDPSGPSGN